VFKELGLTISRTTVYKTLKLLNMSHKVATRSRQHQPIDRSHPFFYGDPFAENAMAFDESGFCINEIPKTGWGKKGSRVPKPQIARSKRISLLLVTDRKGIVASKIVYGGVKSAQVSEFVKTLPDNRPMILDNCAIHKTKEVRNICHEKGITLNFIPPYSPWYNPVENAFAQAKATFHKLRLSKGCFDTDVLTSVAAIKNFAGIFSSSLQMWLEDRTVDCNIYRAA
jgi:transposase